MSTPTVHNITPDIPTQMLMRQLLQDEKVLSDAAKMVEQLEEKVELLQGRIAAIKKAIMVLDI